MDGRWYHEVWCHFLCDLSVLPMNELIPHERIVDKILIIRWEKVLLDRDLAQLYGVETRVLKQAVRRNYDCFPKDFMLTLNENEVDRLVSQSVIPLKSGLGWAFPFAFTEHGVLMLANVLKSSRAIEVSIHIIRVFNEMRKILASQQRLQEKLQEIEQRMWDHDEQFLELWFELKKISQVEFDNKRKIWFTVS
jgi:hypothetical protein